VRLLLLEEERRGKEAWFVCVYATGGGRNESRRDGSEKEGRRGCNEGSNW
jgi:hypothetical protein